MSVVRQQNVQERRKEKRIGVARYLLQIEVGGGRPPIMCYVFDVSGTGMHLKLAADIEVPDQVRILMSDGTRDAKVVWRDGRHIGLEFV